MTGEVPRPAETARMTAAQEIEHTIRELRRYADNQIVRAIEDEAHAVGRRAHAQELRAKADEYERALRLLTGERS